MREESFREKKKNKQMRTNRLGRKEGKEKKIKKETWRGKNGRKEEGMKEKGGEKMVKDRKEKEGRKTT